MSDLVTASAEHPRRAEKRAEQEAADRADALVELRIMRQKRGAKPVAMEAVREIVDGLGDPHYRLEKAKITPFDLACALVSLHDHHAWRDAERNPPPPTRTETRSHQRLLAAAKMVLAGLDERIKQSDPRDLPVFHGIAVLHAAIGEVERTGTGARSCPSTLNQSLAI